MESNVVFYGAMNALTHIGWTNGGRLPVTLEECLQLPTAYGIDLQYYNGRGAKLVIEEDELPVLFINSKETEHRQMCGIIHDTCEYLTLGDFPDLFNERPVVLNQDGGQHPRDIRHRIARFAEDIYKAWLERQ